MKHLLNIVPTIKYRGESSFMFKTVLALLYAIPTLLAIYMGMQYLDAMSLNEESIAASDRLEKKQAEISKNLNEMRPDKAEYQSDWDRTIAYYHSLRSTTFSWTALFSDLEKVLPTSVRITRIRVRPDASVRLNLQGEATRLEEVTGFLRRLFENKRFDRPRLTQHVRVDRDSHVATTTASEPAAVVTEAVTFALDVDYIPTGEGARP
ncbi:MAG: PilN domain-containing protein [Candidatus Riflebacteria bacterium]|nr:PilN domain-containing protein [Candidatus Riflebacteria bacterium]